MIAVTIGVGEGWKELAERSALQMAAMTGLETRVIDVDDYGCAHPSWLKCHVHRIFPEEDSFLVFDADVLAIRGWDPEEMFEVMRRPFMAVPEPNANPTLMAECRKWAIGGPDVYVNGGFLIYGREHGYIWDRTWARHPHGGSWLEQTALNRSILDSYMEVCRLPRHFNLLAQAGRIRSLYSRSTLRHAYNVHACAMKSAEEVSEFHQWVMKYLFSGKAGANRADLLDDIAHHVGIGSRGAEIGVFAGDFSRQIDHRLRPAVLHLVDLFDGTVTSGDENGQCMRTIPMNKVAQELAQEISSAQIHKADSVEWLRAQPPGSLDWVYLDTTHEYDRTREELAAARRAVRAGGIIAGHDFSYAFPGVQHAVREFCEKIESPYRVYDGDLLPSFAIFNIHP